METCLIQSYNPALNHHIAQTCHSGKCAQHCCWLPHSPLPSLKRNLHLFEVSGCPVKNYFLRFPCREEDSHMTLFWPIKQKYKLYCLKSQRQTLWHLCFIFSLFLSVLKFVFDAWSQSSLLGIHVESYAPKHHGTGSWEESLFHPSASAPVSVLPVWLKSLLASSTTVQF